MGGVGDLEGREGERNLEEIEAGKAAGTRLGDWRGCPCAGITVKPLRLGS